MRFFLKTQIFIGILCSTALKVSADEYFDNNEGIFVSDIEEEEVEAFSLDFAESISGIQGLSIDDIIPVFDSTNSLIGYSVSFVNSDMPYGYLTLDLTKESPVMDFVLNDNVQSIYENMRESLVLTIEDRLIYFEGLLYAVTDGEYFYFSNGDIIEASDEFLQSSGTKYTSHRDIYSKSCPGTFVTAPVYTSKYSYEKSLFSETYIESLTGSYACAVVALTAVARQENILLNSSIYDTYSKLWKLTKTTVIYSKNNIDYGSTPDSTIASAFKSYAISKGKTNTTVLAVNNPRIAFYKALINNNLSGVFCYRINVGGEVSGHCVNVVGYCSATVAGVYTNYLLVANGWERDAPVYLNMTSTDFINSYGVQFTVK